MTQDARSIEYALTHKGFSRENAKHHVLYWLYVNGKKTSVRTRMSHGVSEIGDQLIACMAREMRVSKAEFLQFVACTISGDDYRTLMIAEGQVRETDASK